MVIKIVKIKMFNKVYLNNKLFKILIMKMKITKLVKIICKNKKLIQFKNIKNN